jgi:hypothetical protein
MVDAGYFDNYGLEIACGWLCSLLKEREEWLRQHVSAVLVVQIRDNVSNLSVNPETEERSRLLRGEKAAGADLARGLEGITSPVEGVLAARDSAALFRNDALLQSVTGLYARAFGSDDYLTTTVFEFAGEASLSWTLAPDEIDALAEQVTAKGIDDKIEAIRRWLNGGVKEALAQDGRAAIRTGQTPTAG